MPRKGNTPKREVLPDPVYGSVVVAKLINSIMLDGKKGVAQKIVYGAFARMEEKAGKDGLQECVLFVRNDNQEAVRLYEKCGYHVLREHGYGRYMNKTL